MRQKLFTKNFTLLVFGQASSLFGNLILKFALSMHVLEVTGSAAAFAGILAVATVPTILLSPLGGILADRANRRNVMVALDALTGIFVLGAVRLLPEDGGLAVIGGLLVLLSVLGAFETPTVQSCVPQMHAGDNIVRGNAVIGQVAAVASLIAPVLGSVLYVAFGLRPVMLASVFFFFLTAASECFIHLQSVPRGGKTGVLKMIQSDFSVSMRFLCVQQRGILKLLLLAALVNFFVMGTALVGLPYLVRTVLDLSAGYYGAAESALGVAAILGGAAAGVLSGKLKTRRLFILVAALGIFLAPAGIVFLLPAGTIARYVVNVVSFCGVELSATLFSIFAVSTIQQRTPNHLLGKVMAYTYTITLCVQPLGQLLYGFLFDRFRAAAYLVLIPTGAAVCLLGLLSAGLFRDLDGAWASEKQAQSR